MTTRTITFTVPDGEYCDTAPAPGTRQECQMLNSSDFDDQHCHAYDCDLEILTGYPQKPRPLKCKECLEGDNQDNKECGSDTNLWGWFGLSYASWLTLPRVLMHNMPSSWQDKMAELLSEYDEKYNYFHRLEIATRVQITKKGKLIKTPEWLINYRRPDMETIDKLVKGDLEGSEK